MRFRWWGAGRGGVGRRVGRGGGQAEAEAAQEGISGAAQGGGRVEEGGEGRVGEEGAEIEGHGGSRVGQGVEEPAGAAGKAQTGGLRRGLEERGGGLEVFGRRGFPWGAGAEVADADEVGDEAGEAEEEGVGGEFGEGWGAAGAGDLGDGVDERHEGGDEAVGGVEGGGREHEQKENIRGGGSQGGDLRGLVWWWGAEEHPTLRRRDCATSGQSGVWGPRPQRVQGGALAFPCRGQFAMPEQRSRWPRPVISSAGQNAGGRSS